MRILLIVLFSLISSISASAQSNACGTAADQKSRFDVQGENWSKLITSVSANEAGNILVTDSSEIWLVGRCVGKLTASIVKLRTSGDVFQNQEYEKAATARFDRVDQDSHGNIWAAGLYSARYSSPKGPRGLVVYRFDQTGAEPHRVIHESQSYDGVEALLSLDDGGMLIVHSVGTSHQKKSTGQAVEVVRYDQSLEVDWVYQSKWPGDDMARDAAIASNGDIWVVGKKWTGKPKTGIQAWVGRFNANGKLKFNRFFGNKEHPASFDAIVATDDGGAWVSGNIGGRDQAVLMRLNANGRIVREIELDLPISDSELPPAFLVWGKTRLMDIVKLPDGRILAVGHFYQPKSELDAILVLVNTDGRVEKVEVLSTEGSEALHSAYVLDDGSVIVAGATSNGSSVFSRKPWVSWLFRIDANGKLPNFDFKSK